MAVEVRDFPGVMPAAASPLDPLLLSPAAFGWPDHFAPSYWYEHAPFAFWLIGAQRPRVLVELGAHAGFSFAAFCQQAAAEGLETRCFAVDTWAGDPHNGVTDERLYESLRHTIGAKYGGFARLIRATFDDARAHFADGSVDLLHIDGYHTYEAVRRDFESWRAKLSERAVVLFHDTNVRTRDFGVHAFWAEVASLWPSFEFLHGHGLGVLGVGADQPEPLRRLFAAGRDPAETAQVRAAYARLGAAIDTAARLKQAEEAPAVGGGAPGVEAAALRAEVRSLLRALRAQRRAAAASERVEAERLVPHPLFDPAWYAERNPDVVAAGEDLLQHYLRIGDAEGRSPSPLFDPVWYRARYPDAAADDGPALSHFLRVGAGEDREPHPLFDPAYYRRQCGMAQADAVRLMTHYAERGWMAGLRPHPLFDPDWYVNAYGDLVGDPLTDFVRTAGARDPNPAFLGAWRRERFDGGALSPIGAYRLNPAECAPNPLFDAAWYASAYGVGADRALEDYLSAPRGSRNPHPLFDSAFYLERAPDVAEAGDEPLGHYLRRGAFEGRRPHPLFDPGWYWRNNPDVAGQDALRHYLEWGAAEGRDPHPLFDQAFYASQVGAGPEPPAPLPATRPVSDPTADAAPGSLTFAFTSIALNYAPKACVLARTLRRHAPTMRLCVVVAEPCEGAARAALLESFDEVIAINELGIEDWRSWIFQHDLVEACTAVKGQALVTLLERPACRGVFYFDPDIAILSDLGELLAALEQRSILLTPHLSEPEESRAGIEDNELSALRCGTFNLGFLGVRASAEGVRFARWWRDRLRDFCRADIPSGLFTDQRWADLAPSFFEDLSILRDPGYNVAPWNVSRRPVVGDFERGFTAAGRPLVFFHFSGFDSGANAAMTEKYAGDNAAVAALRAWYAEATRTESAARPWRLGFFDDGGRISATHRRRYRDDPNLRARFPDPFAAEPSGGFSAWLRAAGSPVTGDGAAATLAHYLTHGERQGLKPNPHFDPEFYRANNGDLEPGVSPLVHYATVGWREGRQPSADFEPALYRTQLGVEEAREEPIGHYRRRGRALGLRVNRRFDPMFDQGVADGFAAALSEGRPVILMLNHALGGGTERHVLDLVRLIEAEADVLLLRPGPFGRLRLSLLNPMRLGHLTFGADQIEPLIGVLRRFRVSRCHVHHVLGMEEAARAVIAGLGVPFDFTQHDYFVVSPQPFLAEAGGRFVGEDLAGAESALVAASQASQAPSSLACWRDQMAWLWRDADRWIAPSADVAQRMARLGVGRTPLVARHPEPDRPLSRPAPRRLDPGEPLTVALIGAISRSKGADVLLEAARLGAARGAPLRFTVLGTIDDPHRAALPLGVSVSDWYEEADFAAMLARSKPDLAWFPAQVPESYSYTLSAALQAGLPILASALGAFPERLAGADWAWLAPWDLSAAEWVDLLLALRERHFLTGAPPERIAMEAPALHDEPAFYPHAYLAPARLAR